MNKNVVEAQSKLNVDFEKGLSDDEAQKRLKANGPNKLKTKKKNNFFYKFINQFYDPLLILLVIASIISFVVAGINSDHGQNPIEKIVEWVEPGIILLIVLLNALFGAFQEHKAQLAMEALNKMSTPISKVIRNGQFDQISSDEIVEGDIVILEAGDTVPADGIIIEASSLKVIESVLTGESIAAEKDDEFSFDENTPIGDRLNCVFSGTNVINGRAKILVTKTGMNTEIGKIAQLLEENSGGLSPLEKRISKLGKILTAFAVVCLAIVFILYVTYVNNVNNIQNTWANGFKISVSIAIAVIPEGLLAILTVILALGVKRMVKRNALIKKISSVETLGSASVICSDKTGTLTQNKMTVVQVFAKNKSHKEFKNNKDVLSVIEYGLLCNDTKIDENEFIGDPTETSIYKLAKDNDIDYDSVLKKYPRVEELPFDSERKLMTTIHKIKEGYLVVTKGAPDNLFNLCKDSDLVKIYNKQNEEMSKQALRVLAVAIKKIKTLPKTIEFDTIEKDLTLVGLYGIIDPPREEVKQSIKECLKAGIRPIMITGDHANTASAIARDLGILNENQKTLTGAELSKMSDEEFNANIKDYSVYARVSPEDKIRVVKAWQNQGDIVAMTGDGVNDAPALQAADIGCAMGITGTEVSKGAADMILVDDNFSTIVEAVKEGRGVLDNIKRMMLTLFTTNITELFALLVGMLIFKFNPLSALQILWVNLVTESFPGIALGMKKAEKNVMEFKPNNSKNLLDKKMVLKVFAQGLYTSAIALTMFFIGSSVFVNFDFHTTVQILSKYETFSSTATNINGIMVDRNFAFNMQISGSTLAFIVLSISQSFNAFNMFSKDHIYKYKWDDVKYLLYAFSTSLFFILMVILIPKMNEVFNLNPYGFASIHINNEATNTLNFSWIVPIAFIAAFVPTMTIELLKILNNSKWYKNLVKKNQFLYKWNTI